MWNFIGLWSVTFIVNPLSLERLRFFAYAWGGVFPLGLAAIVVHMGIYATRAPLRVQFPGRALTESIVSEWQKNEPGTFPSYIIGDTWLAGNVALRACSASAHTRPWLVMADPVYQPVDRRERSGTEWWHTLVVQQLLRGRRIRSIPPYYLERLTRNPATANSSRQPAVLPPVVAGWAILPPRRD